MKKINKKKKRRLQKARRIKEGILNKIEKLQRENLLKRKVLYPLNPLDPLYSLRLHEIFRIYKEKDLRKAYFFFFKRKLPLHFNELVCKRRIGYYYLMLVYEIRKEALSPAALRRMYKVFVKESIKKEVIEDEEN